jgi:predicted NUDIX family NTP pyrophosphohydrolase
MAEKTSSGLLMYRLNGENLEVFLVHPGAHVWTQHIKKMILRLND